jgi:hypothetical protein
LWTCPWRGYWDSSPFLSLSFPAAVRWAVCSTMCCPPWCTVTTTGTKCYRPKVISDHGLKPWTKVNFSSLYPNYLMYFVTVTESWVTPLSIYFLIISDYSDKGEKSAHDQHRYKCFSWSFSIWGRLNPRSQQRTPWIIMSLYIYIQSKYSKRKENLKNETNGWYVTLGFTVHIQFYPSHWFSCFS